MRKNPMIYKKQRRTNNKETENIYMMSNIEGKRLYIYMNVISKESERQ